MIVLVWNNQAYGEIKTYMVEQGIAPIGVDLYTPDLAWPSRRGYGCFAERARDHEHLAVLLADARGRATPSLIEVMEEGALRSELNDAGLALAGRAAQL